MGHWYNPQSSERSDFPRPGWLPSVSTILEITQPYSEQQALRNSALRQPFKAAQRLAEASNRGANVHAWIAAYLHKGLLPELPLSYHPWCQAVKPYLDYLRDWFQRSKIETPVFHYAFAGQPDLVAIRDDRRIIIDFKTKDKPIHYSALHRAELQLTGYAEAYEYEHCHPVGQLVGVIIYPTHIQIHDFDCATYLEEWRYRRSAYVYSTSGAQAWDQN